MKKKNAFAIACAAFCVLTTAIYTAFAQGSLTPPSGPPAPMMKTLQQIEPRTDVLTLSGIPIPGWGNGLFTITQPGSYYLSTNVIGASNRCGIVIASDDVTLDLNGFSLLGGGPAGGIGMSGVFVPQEDLWGWPYRNIAVLNGTVEGWGRSGIDCSWAENVQFKDLRASRNVESGLRCGFMSTVINCQADSNLRAGIETGNSSVVRDCSVQWNDSGITCGGGSVSTCTVYGGNTGISAGGSIVRDCTVSGQSTNGIMVGSFCQVLNNNCGQCYGSGVHVIGIGNRIEGNQVAWSQTGIRVDGTNNLVTRNSASRSFLRFSDGTTGTNYLIAPGNCTGIIVTNETSMNAATSPNVNFSF